MTMMWPTQVLWPSGVSLDLASRSLAAPASVSGASQVVASDAGIWKLTFRDLSIATDTQLACFRGIAGLLEGRLNPIVVPLFPHERRLQPVLDAGFIAEVPHEDDTLFDDGTGYVGSTTSMHFAADVGVRAVSATVMIDYGGTLQPGQRFSVGERLYRLHTVVYSSDSKASVTFRPPLREAVKSGTYLEFDEPKIRVRLATDGEMDLPLDHNVTGVISINFIEDV